MSEERKEIGKIERVSFGLGGYQDACIGIHFTLSGKSWGTVTGMDGWDAAMITVDKHTKWTEADRDAQYSKIVRYVSDLLAKAKVKTVDDLKGIPIEATFERQVLKKWRILDEAL